MFWMRFNDTPLSGGLCSGVVISLSRWIDHVKEKQCDLHLKPADLDQHCLKKKVILHNKFFF